MKTIKIELNTQSIRKAYKEFMNYKAWVERKTEELAQRLADIGVQEAQYRFDNAQYDGDGKVEVSVVKTDNGYKVEASGQAVCFIEFGAGVYYNGTEPYPVPRPDGISKIGEYGRGQGKNKGWYFTKDGKRQYTHGNPAAMPMWHATKEMEAQLLNIAKEVFGNG